MPMCGADIACSSAEVATGIICVSLPTLAALAHRQPRGPTASIINGLSNPRGQSYHRRKHPSDSDDRTLFSGDYLELREGAADAAAVKAPAAAITTGGKGGSLSPDTVQDSGNGTHGIAVTHYGNEIDHGTTSIMKTVRIEQSYI